MITNKIIVVHAGRRDDYQVALAFNENNLLECLVTDIYWPLDNILFNKFMSWVKLNRLAEKKFKQGLSYKNVVISKRALCLSLIMRVFKTTKFNPLSDKLLGLKANKIARRLGCNILSMNTYGCYAFRDLPNANKILFQFHPHPLAVQKLFLEEISLYPQSSISLNKEYELTLSAKTLQCLVDEPLIANYIITASSYTKNTLIEYGAKEEQIKVIPYGVDIAKFPFHDRRIHKKSDPQTFNILFIGSLNQRKGVLYLLEAIERLGEKNVQLLIVGRGIFDLSLLNSKNINVTIFNNLSHSALVGLMRRSDVFVLPSIVEGFAQVLLEAMSCGLPIITTKNTAGPDIITNGKEGFIIPIRDVAALMQKLSLFITNPDLVENMGRAASIKAACFTWERFRTDIVEAYKKIVQ